MFFPSSACVDVVPIPLSPSPFSLPLSLSPSLPFPSCLPLSCADNEGWFFGTSHNSGMSGLYPGNYVEKTKDSECWTLHR